MHKLIHIYTYIYTYTYMCVYVHTLIHICMYTKTKTAQEKKPLHWPYFDHKFDQRGGHTDDIYAREYKTTLTFTHTHTHTHTDALHRELKKIASLHAAYIRTYTCTYPRIQSSRAARRDMISQTCTHMKAYIHTQARKCHNVEIRP